MPLQLTAFMPGPSNPGAEPAGWGTYTLWQYSSTPIDQNQFNGAIDRLQALALG